MNTWNTLTSATDKLADLDPWNFDTKNVKQCAKGWRKVKYKGITMRSTHIYTALNGTWIFNRGTRIPGSNPLGNKAGNTATPAQCSDACGCVGAIFQVTRAFGHEQQKSKKSKKETDRLTNGPIKRGVETRSTWLKNKTGNGKKNWCIELMAERKKETTDADT